VKKLVTLAATSLAALAFVTAANADTARLTIPALGIFNKPIGVGEGSLAYGPVWDLFPTRPTRHTTVVLAGHDVTPVPGYGNHGPFHDLVALKKGYLIEITWHSRLYRYRVARDPFYQPENDWQLVVIEGQGAVWLYSCWPRHTHNGRQWVKGVLFSVTPQGHKQ
jgi:sortase (surface protein transpeptidase)